jgi:hypothetical protein
MWLNAISVAAIATVGGLAYRRFAEPATAGAPEPPAPQSSHSNRYDSAS